jgi:hypothetical protein
LNKNTSSRVITQPNIIRQERNSNLNDMWLYLDELQFKFEFRSVRMTFWLSYDPWTCIFVQILSCPDFFLTSLNMLTRNSNLNCNSSRYSDIPNIKSIYQRTSRKSPDNLKFKQEYKFKGHNSSKYHFLSCPGFFLTSLNMLTWYLVFGYI